MNCDRPGSMTRNAMTLGAVPSKLTKRAVAVVVCWPRFWMMNGVSKPKNRRVMFGRKTLGDPTAEPSYDIASERLPEPPCSFTTETTVDPKLWITTPNWLSNGRSRSLFGTSAYDVPGCRVVIFRHVISEPSVHL